MDCTVASSETFMIRPHGPILVRDGRPFTSDPGAYAVSLPWPMPSTVAGALRSHIGAVSGFDWTRDGPSRALQISVEGPLLAARQVRERWQVYLPAPKDALWFDPPTAPRVYRLRPLKGPSLPGGGGCNMPNEALVPVAVDSDEKPLPGRDYWALTECVKWLSGRDDVSPSACLDTLPVEERTHVTVDRRTRAAQEGMLFTTRLLCLSDVAGRLSPEVCMLVRVGGSGSVLPGGVAPAFMTLGGERRVAVIERAAPDVAWPQRSPELTEVVAVLRREGRLRLQIVTPAAFTRGWVPGWVGDDMVGSPWFAPKLKLRLVSACVGRRLAVSGWRLDRTRGLPAPKPVRYTVPPGSVYFFQIESGTVDDTLVNRLWLLSVSDDEQSRLDSFGLAVPGVWDYASGGV